MNQSLKEFTFILTTITVVGPVVLYFLKFKNKYATEYWKWFKQAEKLAYKLWKSLPADVKILIALQAKNNAKAAATHVNAFLQANGVDKKIANVIVLAGSKAVKEIAKKEIKWLDTEVEKDKNIK